MPDLIDFAQEREAEAREAAIAEYLRRRQIESPRGLHRCSECEEPITDLRRLAGATRCVECQTVHETRERIFRGTP